MLLNICIFLSIFEVIEYSTHFKLSLNINLIKYLVIDQPEIILAETMIETACDSH